MLEDNWITGAVAALAIEGVDVSLPVKRPRGRPRKTPIVITDSEAMTAAQPEVSPPKKRGRPRKVPETISHQETVNLASPALTPSTVPVSGQTNREAHTPAAADGMPYAETLSTIVEQHRRRWDMIRARQRLELQGQAVCRRLSDGDKVAAGKLWAEIVKDEGHELRGWIGPYIAAMEPLQATQATIEAELVKLVRKLPVYPWAKAVKGLGDISLSAIIGECAAPIGSYKSVAAVWKRMGLAVIGDGRQRKIAGDAAIEHGYNPERRAIMWNIGACLLKAQVRKDPEDDEKRIAIGDLGEVYLARKAFEAERVETKAHAHNRAQRYMEKRLLREMYAAWRRADGIVDPIEE